MANSCARLPRRAPRGIPHLKSKKLVRLLPGLELLSDSFRLIYRKGSRFAEPLRELAAFLRERPLR